MIKMDSFVNLHVHSIFSKQDAVIKIDELVDKVIEYDQQAIAITDHSSTAAHYYLKKICEEKGIKPIFGNEFYTNLSYENKTRDRHHLVCLAMTDEGLRNINRLQDIAVHHRYYKPIVSHEILPEYTEGIYATSACTLGVIPQAILNDDLELAEEYCHWFMDIFHNNFSLELQMHPGYQDQYTVNNGLISLSEDLGIPLTVSSDAHFLTAEDADLRRVIQCIAWSQLYENGKDSLSSNCLGNSQIILNNAEKTGFPLDIVQKAMKQTIRISELCNGHLCEEGRKVPIFNKYEEFDKLFNEEL